MRQKMLLVEVGDTDVVSVGEMATVGESETHDTVLRLNERGEGSEAVCARKPSAQSFHLRSERHGGVQVPY